MPYCLFPKIVAFSKKGRQSFPSLWTWEKVSLKFDWCHQCFFHANIFIIIYYWEHLLIYTINLSVAFPSNKSFTFFSHFFRGNWTCLNSSSNDLNATGRLTSCEYFMSNSSGILTVLHNPKFFQYNINITVKYCNDYGCEAISKVFKRSTAGTMSFVYFLMTRVEWELRNERTLRKYKNLWWVNKKVVVHYF